MSRSEIEKIIALVEKLSEDTRPEDIDELLYHIQLKKDILEGIKELDEGKGIPHKKVKDAARTWLK